MLVTGQSFVLYSRLGVVLGPSYASVLKAAFWMIVIDGIIFHISTTVVLFGAFNARPNYNFAQAYKYIEEIQMTGFTIQELILSGLYVWRTLDILRTSDDWNRRRTRVMRELLGINVLIILMDIALLVVEYQDRHVIEQALKEFIYSVKLKLEFAILSKLVDITQRGAIVGTPDAATGVQLAGDKTGAEHVERTFSHLSTTTYHTASGGHAPSLSLVTTEDRQKRKRLEDDAYGSFCKDLAST